MTPQTEAIVINKTLQGQSSREIAPQVNLSHVSVTHHQARLRDHIQKQAAELLNRGLIPARRTLTRLAAIGNTKTADKDQLKLSLDASKVILSASGILASAGTTINNMIQINANETPELVQQLFDKITHTTSKSLLLPSTKDVVDV
jgi:hypothetical protein